jgi:predicted transcriptional regulator
MNTLTVKQLSEKLGQDYLVTSNLVKFLVAKGLVKQVGKVQVEGKKGKPSFNYEFPEKVEISLWNSGWF